MTKVDAGTLYGTLNLLILKSLADGDLHGLAIARRILAETDDVLSVEEGALYPALHRLERDGLIEGRWGMSDTRRRVKLYRLTASGRKRLKRDTARWQRHANAVARLLEVSVPGDSG